MYTRPVYFSKFLVYQINRVKRGGVFSPLHNDINTLPTPGQEIDNSGNALK